ncbi:MAG: DNA-deoxyinosine glycosylase [Tepidimonas sp.]|uniref:DNA-deoxyinosine glycosylase n=1 Tax=Tepidimonas sp. TaxID=2002775 RepID=UPI00298F3B89|nr:DNA-deoxyinosine glycosylase [Tepidimonas sp.]MCS6810098.1 DNA-deoxyinosine glycosylase [Tepidimonas sp.]MDW8336547.1 DNA-deoxyinosine glycosylase [Tepidimonas sp.]
MSAMGWQQGLPPVLDERTRVVVLGSFPGQASLRAQQYYAHPRNQFWPILQDLLQQPLTALPYPDRLTVLLRHGLGLWDVYARCVRRGSLDSAIERAELNDLALLRKRCPALVAILHNGGESWRHARHTRALGVAVQRLPSTSPAHASWPLARKRAAWADALARYGVPLAWTPTEDAVEVGRA